jgi:hypothetical protein
MNGTRDATLEQSLALIEAELGRELELRGKLLEMVNKPKPAGGAGLGKVESSLKLFAGVGFAATIPSVCFRMCAALR